MLPHYFMGMNKKLFLVKKKKESRLGGSSVVVVICSRLAVLLHSLQRCVLCLGVRALSCWSGLCCCCCCFLVMPLQLSLEKKLLQYMDLINSPGGYLDVVLKRNFARGSDQRPL